MATVVSVNVGLPRPVDFETTSMPTTGIEKRPVAGLVRITSYGVEGNGCGDTVNHGDPHMRVYAYASEDYRWWEAELGLEPHGLAPGHFAEQLTTTGIDLTGSARGTSATSYAIPVDEALAVASQVKLSYARRVPPARRHGRPRRCRRGLPAPRGPGRRPENGPPRA